MANYITLSNANPIKFYRQSDVFGIPTDAQIAVTNFATFDNNHHTRTIDQDFYYRNIPKWTSAKKYFQPFEYGDPLVLQFEGIKVTAINNPFTINILNAKGGVDLSIVPTIGTAVSGTHRLYGAIIDLSVLPEGVYFVQIKMLGYFDILDEYLISEPIDLKLKHEGSIRVKYWNTSNDFGIYYEEGPQFVFRVHGQIKELVPGSTFNVYENDPADMVMLSGVKKRDFVIEFGGNRNGFPNWMLDKIDLINLHDNVLYDGTAYTRIEGAALEKVPITGTELTSAKLKVRPAVSNTDVTVSDIQSIILFAAMPKGQIIYVDNILGGGLGDITIQRYFLSHDHFLSFLNGYQCHLYRYDSGDESLHFAINSKNQLVAICGNSASQSICTGMELGKCMDTYIKLEVTPNAISSIDVIFDIYDSSGNNIDYAIFPGDGNAPYLSSYAFSDTIVNTYTTAGRYTLYAFFETYESLNLSYSDGIIRSLGGKISPLAYEFIIDSNALNTIENNLLCYTQGYLELFSLKGNRLNSASINNLIIWAYEALNEGYITSALAMYLENQTPAAKPSAGDKGITQLLTKLKNSLLNFSTD